ncbi:MAG: 16S rRNA (cytidine(1402)-2'-O)-methyltransferase, partial [bacterium]|nr:16S rRNA (cytidine(1402)-2'-O)-methyltransferase [bacterium]
NMLYLVPVPIGNLRDITIRAIDTLKEVDFIIAEDTRYSLKHLNHLGIKKKIISYYKPKEQEKAQQIIKKLKENQTAALITDSGTPGISDPGYILVQKAIEEGLPIESLPGPTAFVPALVVSGITTDKFLFLGFPPRKKNELKRYLKNISTMEYTLIFYESPRRVAAFLEECAAILGQREFAIAKELSKKNEKIIRGNLRELKETLSNETILGEIVIIIEGSIKEETTEKPELNSMDDLFTYFKETHNISKNQ